MLQIISGRFFEDGNVNEQEAHSVLYSNLSSVAAIDAGVAALLPAPSRRGVAAYVVRYTNRYEERDDNDILYLATAEEAVEQFRLLCCLWFRSFFHWSHQHVEVLCRRPVGRLRGQEAPSNFVPLFFDPEKRVTAEDITGFTDFVQSVLSMPRTSYRTFIAGLATFADALEAISTNRNVAYSMFVYVLEALGRLASEYTPTWADYPHRSRTAIDAELQGIDESRREAIRGAIVTGSHLKLMKRFIEFVTEHIDRSFFTSEAIGQAHALRKNELREALQNLYDTRSGYVHSLTPIHEHIHVPMIASDSDVIHWEHEPYLTFRGLVRLVRHVLLRFVDRQPHSEREEYAHWRDELPGLLRVQWAPEVWIGRADTFTPAQAKPRFNGLVEYVLRTINQDEPVLPELGPLMAEIEKKLPQAKPSDRPAMSAMYSLYHFIVKEKYRRPNWERVISKHSAHMSARVMEVLATSVLIGSELGWSSTECADVFQAYLSSKFKADAVNLPPPLEVSVMCAIANLHHAEGDTERFREWIEKAVLDAAGNERMQAILSECQRDGRPVSLRALLGVAEVTCGDAKDAAEPDSEAAERACE